MFFIKTCRNLTFYFSNKVLSSEKRIPSSLKKRNYLGKLLGNLLLRNRSKSIVFDNKKDP